MQRWVIATCLLVQAFAAESSRSQSDINFDDFPSRKAHVRVRGMLKSIKEPSLAKTRRRQLMGGDGGMNTNTGGVPMEEFNGFTDMRGQGYAMNTDPNRKGLSRESWASEHGVDETVPCVPWQSITTRQKTEARTSNQCRDLSNGFPLDSGCCRIFYNWLVIDYGGTSNPNYPCICNQYTRDPSQFGDYVATPIVPLTVTPSPQTRPPTAAIPVGPPMPTPSTSPGPSLDHCLQYENTLLWDEQLHPDYANEKRCTASNHCTGMPGSCCLASTCFCGSYQNNGSANQQCLPFGDGTPFGAYLVSVDRTDETGGGGGGGMTIDVNPNSGGGDMTIDVNPNANANANTASNNNEDSNTNPNPNTNANTADDNNNNEDSSNNNNLVPPTPYPATTCADASQNSYWSDSFFSDYTKCTNSMNCTDIPNSCCRAEYCLCGGYDVDQVFNQCILF